MKKTSLNVLTSVVCAAALLAFLVCSRSRKDKESASPPSVSRLRLVDELKPLQDRWLRLDAKVSSLQSGSAGDRPPAEADWPGLIQEAMGLLEQSALVHAHFGSDMSRLRGEKDPVTGLSQAELIQQVYGYVDSLERCILALSGRIYRLHQMVDDGNPRLAEEYRKKSSEYERLKWVCISEGRKAEPLLRDLPQKPIGK